MTMRRITVILKPTSECNFRCQYCYHSDTGYVKGRMSLDLFEEIVSKITCCYNDIVLIFHGGEPLLMGYDFYEKALAILKCHIHDGQRLSMGIQTNGLLLDEKFCTLFQEHGILPAVSFDGPGDLNCLRYKTAEVTSRIVELKQKGFAINLLGVLTKHNIQHLQECYDFAKGIDCHYKLNPVFKSGGAKEDNDYMISADEYVSALKDFLPYWMNDENPISNFEPLTGLTLSALAKVGTGCDSCGCLSKWIAIHHDGELFPCGRSYPQEYSLGNIREIDDITHAFSHPNFVKLLKGAIERRSLCLNSCDYYPICNGGCNNDSIINGDLTRPSGFTCTVYKQMMPFIQEYVNKNEGSIKNPYIKQMLTKIGAYGKHND